MESGRQTPTRRQLLHAIGPVGGTAALYQMMTTFGHAAESRFPGPPNLSGARKGASVIVLGAGLAGMLAAYELEKAGYSVGTAQYAIYLIAKGKGGMPYFSDSLTPAQIADVTNYIRTHFGNTYKDGVTAADVEPFATPPKQARR